MGRRDDPRRERDFKSSYAGGGPGFSGFDRRIERDGLWYELSQNARKLYAMGYLVLERRGLVEATQRDLARACGMAHKSIVAARRELEEARLIRVMRGYSRSAGDVVEMLEYAPQIATKIAEREEADPAAARRAIADIRERFGIRAEASA